MKGRLNDNDLFDFLNTVNDIAIGTSENPELAAAVKLIEEFKVDIASADAPGAYSMVQTLTQALVKVEFTLDCVDKKASAMVIIKNYCQFRYR